ncbi:MAG: hypothetical protein HY553_18265 [Elusimicrobia bacterium]|nr:hypothetical protein [Elusimicrobiota bacterium]
MADSPAIIALWLGLAGGQALPQVGEVPDLRLSEVTGEVRIQRPHRPGGSAAAGAIGSGAEVFVVTGSAAIEADLPATFELRAGDRVRFAAASADHDGHLGLRVAALGDTRLRVEFAEGRIRLGPGGSVALRLKPAGRIAAQVLSSEAEAVSSAWRGTVLPDETLLLRAGPPGFPRPPLDLSRMTVTGRARRGVDFVSIRAPSRGIAVARIRTESLSAGDRSELRSALAATPLAALLAPVEPAGRAAPRLAAGGPPETGSTAGEGMLGVVVVLLLLVSGGIPALRAVISRLGAAR